jgi:hypothetical protein
MLKVGDIVTIRSDLKYGDNGNTWWSAYCARDMLAGIKTEHVETFYVYTRLLEIFFITCEQKAEYMFLDIFKDKKQITIEDIIKRLYDDLGQLKVFDNRTDNVIWDLGKPDYNILPVPSIDLRSINDFT